MFTRSRLWAAPYRSWSVRIFIILFSMEEMLLRGQNGECSLVSSFWSSDRFSQISRGRCGDGGHSQPQPILTAWWKLELVWWRWNWRQFQLRLLYCVNDNLCANIRCSRWGNFFFGECKTMKNWRIKSEFSLLIYDSNYFMSGDRVVKWDVEINQKHAYKFYIRHVEIVINVEVMYQEFIVVM
jgi:hypothetical protein